MGIDKTYRIFSKTGKNITNLYYEYPEWMQAGILNAGDLYGIYDRS